MADIALGGVEKIVTLALKIKEAVETVRQNEKECLDIQRRVARGTALLKRLDETTEIMKDDAMRDALEDLAVSLERALELVTECQRKHNLRRFLGAGDMAKELDRVKNDIGHKLNMGNFAVNVRNSIMLTDIQYAKAPSRPPQPQDAGLVEISESSHLADDDSGNDEIDHGDHDVDDRGWVSPQTSRSVSSVPGSSIRHDYIIDGSHIPSLAQQEGNNTQGDRESVSLGTPRSVSPIPGSSMAHDDIIDGSHIPYLAQEREGNNTLGDRSDVNVENTNVQHLVILQEIGLRFRMSELKAATHNFSRNNIIGEGGFYTVYKGVLEENRLVVAIKKPKDEYFYIIKDLSSSINNLPMFHHKNVVTILGTGVERLSWSRRRLPIYVEEYVPNGSLAEIINNGPRLDWSSRFQIILGVAEGLNYLHGSQVLHMDVNPSNILLNSNMDPKLTDFGFSRRLPRTGSIQVQDVIGTLRYMDPEYMQAGLLSAKCDVYSFGVIVVEIVRGMRESPSNDDIHPLEWAKGMVRQDWLEELFGPPFYAERELEEIRRCMEIGLECVDLNPENRPDMLDVYFSLRALEKARNI